VREITPLTAHRRPSADVHLARQLFPNLPSIQITLQRTNAKVAEGTVLPQPRAQGGKVAHQRSGLSSGRLYQGVCDSQRRDYEEV
jgi:hypothetical protein